MSATLRLFGGQCDEAVGKVPKVRMIRDQQFEVVGLVEQVLLERLRQTGEFRVDLAEPGLHVIFQVRTRADEVFVRLLEQAPLFCVEPEFVGPPVDRVDTLEQGGVQVDVVAVRRQFRSDRIAGLADDVVGMSAVDCVEHPPQLAECRAADFEGDDRVVERGRFRVIRDRVDLGGVLSNPLAQCRQVIRRFDQVEGRYAEWRLPVGEQRIPTRAGHFIGVSACNGMRPCLAAAGSQQGQDGDHD